ncbi:hypothetical protein SPRG_00988 [Saprolegnia parasitica CBS 223.65]|uniref:Choline transporter-like protein n=1 Tax=Saprolegnia parasitica (strain CBS 223.65) TaxID=695850 RepID=A0A067D8D4_SAPPC|nr:hypothetical protein SPRG_00988 [Saprolegnia parasitica CBS 223.65]KDO34926.1 hypothetical protein SPRG_00988 [Saprolegnia parasitica CBS 223.65]|eukprot:XP_012194582.1 hypothetical protein SPRG_00988 [Saprolegnia parasitica CBS 223.65]
MFTRRDRSSSGKMPTWMYSPTGETPPRSNKSSSSSRGGSFDAMNPPWMSSEADPLLPDKDTYAEIGLARRKLLGPTCVRGLTDIIFFVLFVLYWVGMIALGIVAFVQDGLTHKMQYLTEPMDYHGVSCGLNASVYYPLWQSNPDFGVCVASCPHAGDEVRLHVPWAQLNDSTITAPGARPANSTAKDRVVVFSAYETVANNFVCAPNGTDAFKDLPHVSQLNDAIGQYIGGIRENWKQLLSACGIAVGLACVYLIVLRFFGCLVLGLSVVGVQVALILAAVQAWLFSANSDAFDRATQNAFLVLAVLLLCGAILFFFIVVLMVQRLVLAGKFMVFGTRVLYQLPKLLLLPFFHTFLLFLVFIWGLAVTVCLFGAGETVQVEETLRLPGSTETVTVLVASFQRSPMLRWFFLYHAFGIYWAITTILSLTEMTTAMAVSLWYFAPTDKATKEKAFEVDDPVKYALEGIAGNHVGTAALSALVVAPIRYVRNFFMYIEDVQDNESLGSGVANVFSTLFCCCIWCFKSFVIFISKEASFVTAMQGSSFYSAAKVAHSLITSHLLRIGSINRIGNASVLLGKVIICSGACLAAYILMEADDTWTNMAIPMLSIALFSYAIAHTFMSLYETTINVLLLSFTLDEVTHGGRGKAQFAEPDFTKAVNDNLRPKWQIVL